MGWYGCGCCDTGTCEIGTDDFNRASVGTDWSADSGTWSISSNKLYTASASAQITYQTSHPNSEAQHRVSVSIDVSSGDKARIFLSDNVVIEFQRSSTQVIGRIYDDGTLEETGTATTIGDPFTAIVLYREDIGIASASFGNKCIFARITSTATTYDVGLGTGDTNSSGVSFDDFQYYKAYSATNPSCTRYICTYACTVCDEGTAFPTVSITMDSWVNGPGGGGFQGCSGCTDLNATFILDFDVATWVSSSECHWSGSVDITCYYGTRTVYFDLEATNDLFTPPSTFTYGWRLNIQLEAEAGYIEVGNFIWDSEDTATFDCLTSRTLDYIGSSTNEFRYYCDDTTPPTCTLN